jgi:hypothetical protein
MLPAAAGTSLPHSDQGEQELDEVNDDDEVGVHGCVTSWVAEEGGGGGTEPVQSPNQAPRTSPATKASETILHSAETDMKRLISYPRRYAFRRFLPLLRQLFADTRSFARGPIEQKWFPVTRTNGKPGNRC